ncbi:MAG TPA: DUF3857 domain-containing protein [Flavisolibacter sp.]
MKSYINLLSRNIILTAAGLALGTLTQAQGFIDEDFLDKIESNARFMLNEPGPAFKDNGTPSKWDKESAVVIGFSRSILFDKQSRGGFISRKEQSLWFYEKDRFKIKLNDKSAVQAFSEIYFRYGAKEDGFMARIIKDDGTMLNVDLKNAVSVESVDNVPEYFKSFFDKVASSGYRYYKTPVPDLEPGDILEYVTNTRSKLNVASSGYIEFSPVYEVCSKGYPVIHNEIIIETDDKSFFKSLSLNGAPKFTKQAATDKGFYRYVFVDKNRETEKDVNFISPLLQYPVVKFQMIYSNSEDVKGALIGDKGELKTGFSRDELAQKAWEDYEQVGDTYYAPGTTVQRFIDQCYAELAKLGAKNMTEAQYIDRAYYLLRNKIVFRDSYIGDKTFAYVFGSLLFQRDIKSEIVISTGNNIGTIKEVLFDEEIRYVIKVGDKLYFNLTDFSNPGDLVESLLGNEAYIIAPPLKKTSLPQIKVFTLPGTGAADNTEDVKMNVQLSADMKNLAVVKTSTYTGLQKAKAIVEALKYTTYMFDDYLHYGGNPPTQDMGGKQLTEYNSSVATLKSDFKTQKAELLKSSLQSEFGQPVKNIRFDLVSDGRSKKKNTLVTKHGFELEGFVRKAGDKYLINLPGLIGSQLQIKEEERDRQHDIDLRYPKTLTWSINFKIPEGFAAQGLPELSKTVENEAGSFTLLATESDGSIVLNISKVYKQKNISKDKWKDMLAFIDAAYNSNFKYILLTPKQ